MYHRILIAVNTQLISQFIQYSHLVAQILKYDIGFTYPQFMVYLLHSMSYYLRISA